MKRLIKGLLAMTTLLLSSCGNNIVSVVWRYRVSVYYINRDDPTLTICDLHDEIAGKKWTWEGVIDTWIPDNNLSYYFSGYLFEYSNGSHTLIYGTQRN